MRKEDHLIRHNKRKGLQKTKDDYEYMLPFINDKKTNKKTGVTYDI